MMELNPMLRTCLETGTDYVYEDDTDPRFNSSTMHIESFVRMYKMQIPSVCWLTHNYKGNDLKDVYWTQWQIFDLIRQNNIRPEWMRKEDLNELYGYHIPEIMRGYPPERTDDPGGSQHRKHRRRNHTFSQSYA